MKNLIITLALVFTQLSTWASHISAARVYTEPISGSQYELILEIYRDCSGIVAGNMASVTATSAGTTQTYTLPMHSSSFFMDSCGMTTICTSPAGFYYGLEKIVYKTTITIQAPTTFSYANCCLNAGIQNLFGPSSVSTYVECYLDPQGATNTPVEVNNFEELMHLSVLDSTTHNFNIYEQEGDSVVVSATNLMDGSSTSPANYAAGYSASNPLGNNFYYNVSTDGVIDMVNFNSGQYALAYKVEAYRNGTLNWSQLFTAIRIYLNNTTGTAYPPPNVQLVDALSGSTLNSQAPIHVVEGVQYTYLVETSTPMPGGIVTNTYNSLPSGMTLLPGAGSLDTLVWTPTAAQANTFEVLSLRVMDNQCGTGGEIEDEKFHFHVMSAAVTDSVWPGDVDWNLTVDIADPVLIGVAYGTAGTTRANASTIWNAQASSDWNTSFASGANHKHADCDGNGIVDSMDLVAVSNNWGLTHNKKGAYKTTSTLPIYSTASRNSNTEFDIALGTSADPATDIYAVSFDLEIYNKDGSTFKNWTQSPIQLDYSASWLATDLLPFYKPTSQQTMSMMLTRKDQVDNSGQGHLFTIQLDPSMASTYSEVKINNAITYDIEGEAVDTLALYSEIYDITSVSDMESQELSIYTNPNEGYTLQLQLPQDLHGVSIMEVYNNLGQKIYSQETSLYDGRSEIELPELSPASYIIRLIHDDKVWTKKYRQL